VIRLAALTATADPAREIPATDAARLDRIEAALDSLRAEERRLERLGLVPALARCRQQRRYWEFLRAMFQLPAERIAA
jgi:hypothetical protein